MSVLVCLTRGLVNDHVCILLAGTAFVAVAHVVADAFHGRWCTVLWCCLQWDCGLIAIVVFTVGHAVVVGFVGIVGFVVFVVIFIVVFNECNKMVVLQHLPSHLARLVMTMVWQYDVCFLVW